MQSYSKRENGPWWQWVIAAFQIVTIAGMLGFIVFVQIPDIRNSHREFQQQLRETCIGINDDARASQKRDSDQLAFDQKMANDYASDPDLSSLRDEKERYQGYVVSDKATAQETRDLYQSLWARHCKGITPPPYK